MVGGHSCFMVDLTGGMLTIRALNRYTLAEMLHEGDQFRSVVNGIVLDLSTTALQSILAQWAWDDSLTIAGVTCVRKEGGDGEKKE